MINLNAYDAVEEINMGTYIDPFYKTLYIDNKDIKYREYHVLYSKYNPKERCKEFYIYFTDDNLEGIKTYSSCLTRSKKIKVKLQPIWKDNILPRLKEAIKTSLVLVEADDNGEMYYLDI